MNVSIIGASSQSTPALFRALSRSPLLAQMTFNLVGRNQQRLANVVRAIGILTSGRAQVRAYELTEKGLAVGLTDADVVLIQIRYGGLEGRDYDEGFPLTFGICGDEGLGPGGLSAAWRTWPPLKRLLKVVAGTCPCASTFLMTSPVTILTRLARAQIPTLNLRGLCELPWTTLRSVSTQDEDSYDYFGINHLGWIYGIRGHPPIPLKYWRLDVQHQAVLAEQLARQESRAAELTRLSIAADVAYAAGTQADIEAAIAARETPWYSDSVAPLLESFIARRSAVHFFFTTPNAGWNKSFPEDDILEIPFCWEDGRLAPRRPRMAPDRMLIAKLAPFIVYERTAAAALLARDPSAVEAALQLHPWVRNRADAHELTEAIVNPPSSAEAATWLN